MHGMRINTKVPESDTWWDYCGFMVDCVKGNALLIIHLKKWIHVSHSAHCFQNICELITDITYRMKSDFFSLFLFYCVAGPYMVFIL